MKTRQEISAGGVIYRDASDQTEVCLIATNGGKMWQLPKGIIEEDEAAEEAARREVAEETGLRGELLQPLEKIEYWYSWDYGDGLERVHKFVYFFLLRYIDGSTEDHDDEVDEARWFPLADALNRLTHENEMRVMKRAAEALEAEERVE